MKPDPESSKIQLRKPTSLLQRRDGKHSRRSRLGYLSVELKFTLKKVFTVAADAMTEPRLWHPREVSARLVWTFISKEANVGVFKESSWAEAVIMVCVYYEKH